jgi:hypothetical protein
VLVRTLLSQFDKLELLQPLYEALRTVECLQTLG